MILPQNVQKKINEMLKYQNLSNYKCKQKSLTNRYKNYSGTGTSLIESMQDGLLYAFSRMPATFSVMLMLLRQLSDQGLLEKFDKVIDVGSGTGAGYFALKEFDKNIKVSLFERDKNMIKIFNCFETGEVVEVFDLTKDETVKKADLVMTSYVLSELSDDQRIWAAKKLFDMTNKYLLIVDTGTPKVWQQMMKIKDELEEYGANLIAPCKNKKCSLVNDYCQFYARVERSSVHKIVKDATLSYEDEKYFYLFFSKESFDDNNLSRVVRRPSIKPNIISLTLCSKDGVVQKDYTKRNKQEYKSAKKIKINDLI